MLGCYKILISIFNIFILSLAISAYAEDEIEDLIDIAESDAVNSG